MSATDPRRAIQAIWRIEAPRLIAGLMRMVRDVGRAEDLAQEAFVRALEEWPKSGVPDKPGAWLMTVAKRRAIDEIRRSKRIEQKHEELGREIDATQEVSDLEVSIDDDFGDDLL